MQFKSPYIAGPPVYDESKFWGREETIDKIFATLRNSAQNSFAVYGPRKIGKSSILLQLECELSDEDFNQVYIDLSEVSTLPLSEALQRISKDIASAAAIDIPDKTDLEKNTHHFSQKFLPQLNKAVEDHPLVLLLDECNALQIYGPERDQIDLLSYLLKHTKRFKNINIVGAIGRNPDHAILLSQFDEVENLSFLSYEALEGMVRQSELDHSLRWEAKTINHIWQLTHGHPYLAQMLCHDIWENSHKYKPKVTPWVYARDIDQALESTKKEAEVLYEWIWTSLLSTERTVISAIVLLNSSGFSLEDISKNLTNHEIDLKDRDLAFILTKITESRLIYANSDLGSEGELSYTKTFPLFWAWVEKTHPLEEVKKEITGHYDLALSLYQAGERFYNQGKIRDAELELRRAIKTDPSHMESRILLSNILIESNKAASAVHVLQEVDWENTDLLNGRLVKALLARAETENELSQIATYQEVLTLESEQPVAKERLKLLWLRKGEKALEEDLLAEALEAFEHAEAHGRVKQLSQLLREYEVRTWRENAQKHEQAEEWERAAGFYEKIIAKYSDEEGITKRLRNAKSQRILKDKYSEAVSALKEGNKEEAKKLIAEVILRQPDYKEAPQILLQATSTSENSESELFSDIREPSFSTIVPVQKTAELENALTVAQQEIFQLRRAMQEASVRDETYQQAIVNANQKIESLRLEITQAQVRKELGVDQKTQSPASPRPKHSSKPASVPAARSTDSRVGLEQKAKDTNPSQARAKAHYSRKKLDLPDPPKQTVPFEKPVTPLAGNKRRQKVDPFQKINKAVPSTPQNGGVDVKRDISSKKSPLPNKSRGEQNPRREYSRNTPSAHMPKPKASTAPLPVRGMGESKTQQIVSSWIASSLLWLPILAGILWIWFVNPYDWGSGGKFLVSVTSFVAWLVTSHYTSTNNDQTITAFMSSSAVVSFVLGMILTSELQTLGLPNIIEKYDVLFLLGSILYILISAVPITLSGEAMFATAVGVLGGVASGAVLFLTGGGSIEAVGVVIALTVLTLLLRQTDFGVSASIGIGAAIPASFVIYAMTSRLSSANVQTSFVGGTLSFMTFLIVGLTTYILVRLVRRALGY